MNLLYILVRTDMESMGRGRAMAQATHASNQFIYECLTQPLFDRKDFDNIEYKDILNWQEEANGFGTTIILEVFDYEELKELIDNADHQGFPSNLVIDPEYHIQDGDMYHIVPDVVTCGYIFGNKDKLKSLLGELKLYENDSYPKLDISRF